MPRTLGISLCDTSEVDMQLESLKIFCDVVRFHSFSRGANANDVSQSAASQVVDKLEKRLGLKLIDRSRRPWALTEEGKYYYENCQALIDRYEEIEAEVRKRGSAPTYEVRVSAIYSVGFRDLGTDIETFRREMPGSDVVIEFCHPDKVRQSVLEDQADLGLLSFPQPCRDLTTIPWHEERMVVACDPHHPFAGRETISIRELDGERFVAFDRALVIRREVDAFLKQHRVSVDLVSEFDNIETIKGAVEEGVGVAILPEPSLRRETERGSLCMVHLAGARFVRPVCIIHRKKRPLNTAVLRLIEILTSKDKPAKRAANSSKQKSKAR